MLSITSGKQISFILNKDEKDSKLLKKLYIKGDIYDCDDLPPELETTLKHKTKIFKDYIKLNKKLTSNDISSLITSFEKGEDLQDSKLLKVYQSANDFVCQSLKKYVCYSDTELFPIIDSSKTSFRMFISGQSGSGKSYFISQFLKYNKPKPSQGIFIFSPFKSDKSLDDIKNLIYIDLDEFEEENSRPFEAPGDIPEGSVVIFDDIESHTTRSKELMKIRDIFLERGRHEGISVLTISHNPMGSNKTKASIRESNYLVLYPKANPRDTEMLLSRYFGYTKSMVQEVMACKSRWVFISKAVPGYFVSQHSIRVW